MKHTDKAIAINLVIIVANNMKIIIDIAIPDIVNL